MKTNEKIIDGASTDPFDYTLYDENGKKIKDFDCVVMKRKLQAIVQEKTKGMTMEERIAYFNARSEKAPCKGNTKAAQPQPAAVKRMALRKKKIFA